MKIDAIGDFYNLAQVHDGNAGADVTHYGQIVGDKEIGQPESHLQVLDQVNDLRLNGNVQGGDRLITCKPLASVMSMKS